MTHCRIQVELPIRRRRLRWCTTTAPTAACPPQSVSNNYGCPIYRGEIATVPGRNEMYVWYVYFSQTGSLVDGGIMGELERRSILDSNLH